MMSRYALVDGEDIHDDPRCKDDGTGHCEWDGERIRTRDDTGMDQYELANAGLQALEEAREAWDTFIEAWDRVRSFVNDADLHVGRQIEAYRPFTRDQGMGYEPERWMNMVEEALQDATMSPEEDGEYVDFDGTTRDINDPDDHATEASIR